MAEEFNVMNYEQALSILADKIDFGTEIPDIETRKNTLIGFMDYVARL